MVERVNNISNVDAAAGVRKTVQAQKNTKSKNIPMVNTNNLKPEQKEAVENLKKQVKAGHVKYMDANIINDILNFLIDKKSGDYVRISNFADSNEPLTFGDAKRILKLNLPPGSLRHNKTQQGGGDFDRYSVPKDGGRYYLDIFVDDLEEATGLKEDDIKKICNPE